MSARPYPKRRCQKGLRPSPPRGNAAGCTISTIRTIRTCCSSAHVLMSGTCRRQSSCGNEQHVPRGAAHSRPSGTCSMPRACATQCTCSRLRALRGWVLQMMNRRWYRMTWPVHPDGRCALRPLDSRPLDSPLDPSAPCHIGLIELPAPCSLLPARPGARPARPGARPADLCGLLLAGSGAGGDLLPPHHIILTTQSLENTAVHPPFPPAFFKRGVRWQVGPVPGAGPDRNRDRPTLADRLSGRHATRPFL